MLTKDEIKNARILIVDDIEENVDLIEQMLEAQNFTSTLGVTDSREVVSIYQAYSPHLVILDLNMPHKDGFQVMQELKAVSSDDYLPILVLTAQNEQEIKLKALAMGAKDFLSKPFDQAETIHRIENMLEIRVLHDQIKNQNAILEYKVLERTRQLEETQLEIVQRLGTAAEYRDNETGFHILRMSKMAALLARYRGMADADCDLILNASPMHDVGKIGIPDAILLKPGRLTEGEMDLMRKHPEIGARILGDHRSPLLKMARSIALHHHEKWNGTGYPQGLKGEEIPLEGRICAVADVFDALTSKRPYKEAWPIKDALALLAAEAGQHFDPQLIELFCGNFQEFLKISQAYQEPQHA